MVKWEIIWIVFCVNYVSTVLNEINVNSNKNHGSILLEITFWITASYGYDNLKLYYLPNFIILIARCVNDRILELFFQFICIVGIYAFFSCIVEITIATATTTML